MTVELFGFNTNFAVLPTPFVLLASAIVLFLRFRTGERNWNILLIALCFAAVARTLQSMDSRLQIQTRYNVSFRFYILLGSNFALLLDNVLFIVWLSFLVRRSFVTQTSESVPDR